MNKFFFAIAVLVISFYSCSRENKTDIYYYELQGEKTSYRVISKSLIGNNLFDIVEYDYGSDGESKSKNHYTLTINKDFAEKTSIINDSEYKSTFLDVRTKDCIDYNTEATHLNTSICFLGKGTLNLSGENIEVLKFKKILGGGSDVVESLYYTDNNFNLVYEEYQSGYTYDYKIVKVNKVPENIQHQVIELCK